MRILANEQFTETWTLNCGDMLYRPSQYSHHGIAIGECTTYSIGFRAPTVKEMLDDLTTELISKGDSNDVLTDPLLTPAIANQPISSAYLEQIRSLLNKTLNDDKLLLNWFAQYMTQPKYPEFIDETGERRAASIKINENMSLKYHNGDLI